MQKKHLRMKIMSSLKQFFYSVETFLLNFIAVQDTVTFLLNSFIQTDF